jgi:hypothetical protein
MGGRTMMPDFRGIFTLAMIGLGAIAIMIFALPMAGLAGIAWMLEPRAGEAIWTISFWLSVVWGLAVAAFFGSAFFWRR